MKNLISRIKFWFWWHFKATEKQKSQYDMLFFGTGIMKDGKRVNPKNVYLSRN